MPEFPDDEDGAVLAELAVQGIDLSKPLPIEYAVAVPSEESANSTAEALTKAGYEVEIDYDEGEPDEEDEIDEEDDDFGPSWSVYANVTMVPKYDEIIRIQAELDQLARPFGGYADGWGVLIGGDDEHE